MLCVLLLSQACLLIKLLTLDAFFIWFNLLVLAAVTCVMFFVSPIISFENCIEPVRQLTPEMCSEWWNFYKHPLTADSSMKEAGKPAQKRRRKAGGLQLQQRTLANTTIFV